jgi:hypothetical protein
MSAAAWLACDNVEAMMSCFPVGASDRKLRLFAVACCRRLPGLSPLSRQALDLAERFAEGLARVDDLARVSGFLLTSPDQVDYPLDRTVNPEQVLAYHAPLAVGWTVVSPDIHSAAEAAAQTAYYAGVAVPGLAERSAQADLLADLLLRPPCARLPEGWRTWNDGMLVQLAESIHFERAFDRLPILADALEDAGCTDLDILTHCRGAGPHFRGCWALDLLLGKS